MTKDDILFNYSTSFGKLFRLYSNISNTKLLEQLESNLENIEKIISDNIDIFEKYLNIGIEKFEIVYRNNTYRDKYSMKWHIDDKQLIKKNINDIEKIHSIEIIHQDDKHIYGLYGCKTPKYSIIVYLDSHNIDFEGGEFHFMDEIIFPKRGDILIFDSREVHKVSLLTSGRRRAILIKIF